MVKMTCKWCGRVIQDDLDRKGVFRGLCDSCSTIFRFFIGLTLGGILVSVLLFFVFATANYLRHIG
ncbi:MAG: hypothetical protein ACFUZC_06615 [Chthoniobacteraceae bacterium]